MSNCNKSIEKIDNSLQRLIRYVEEEKFMGYDPYDTLNSPYLSKLPIPLKFAFLQFQKRNPLNIRPLLKIKKIYVHKGMALFLHSFSNLALLEINARNEYLKNEYLAKCEFLYEWLINNHTPGYKGLCWSIDFPIASINSVRPKNDPSSVLACFVGNAMYEYHALTKNNEIVDVMENISEFLFQHIPITENQNGICFSYTTRQKNITYNANMLVAEFFTKLYTITGKKHYLDTAERCVSFTLAYQKDNGCWPYSINKNGKERMQLDFHQGFVLDSLFEHMKVLGCTKKDKHDALIKGADYYKQNLFNAKGVSYWRYPKKLPVDIHNQAQGIITFSKLAKFNYQYGAFAEKIALWTISKMQSHKGYFYHQKRGFIVNKIPYIRWSQAWMMMALTSFKMNLD